MNKQMFGMDCMGCGLQRSVALLFHGEFVAAFKMYPAIYPLVLFFLVILLNTFFKIKNANKIMMALAIITGATILINYIYKITTNQLY